MAAKAAATDVVVNGGKEDFVDINAVRKEFRVIEDAALAQRLQDEEFQNHYIRNRKDRGTARIDVKAAKDAYLEEVKTAGILSGSELNTLSEDTVWLAAELNKRVDEEADLERQRRQASELQDEEYARYLQEQERERIERARRRRLEMRFEKDRASMEPGQGAQGDNERRVFVQEDNQRELSTREADTRRVKLEREIPVTRQYNELYNDERALEPRQGVYDSKAEVDTASSRMQRVDLRSMQITMDPQETERLEQEKRDEELARRLQLQEREKQRRILEERDRRLAIKIQRKEAEAYRRRKAERDMQRAVSLPNSEIPSSVVDGVFNEQGQAVIPEEGGVSPEIRRAASFGTSTQSEMLKKSQESPWELQKTAVHTDTGNIHQEKRPNSTRRADDSRSRNGTSVDSSYAVERVVLPENETFVPKRTSDNRANLPELELTKTSDNVSLRQQNARLPSGYASGDPESPRQFNNIAEVIDPTFKNSTDENGDHIVTSSPVTEPNEPTLGSPSTPSRPVPVIQNIRRKNSKEDKKKRKSSEKCKQQ